jgi:cytochrome c oxidase subunit 3
MTEIAISEPANLQEPWPTYALQREGVSVGMWVFLVSEVLFFSALFAAYAVYRNFNAEAFRIAGVQTDIVYGIVNTLALLTSSLTMTIAVRAIEAGLCRVAVRCLIATALLGTVFIVVKGMEYHDDLSRSLFPGAGFPLKPPQTQLFWMLYWVMTGIHAVHLTIGVLIVLTVAALLKWETAPIRGSTIEGLSIYWHFVDCVWLVLFPLLYLVGR